MSTSSLIERLSQSIDSHRSNITSRPFITLTYAQSLDGSIAAERGKQLILSSHESMVLTHQLRTMHQAILVGVGTVIADNPRLNARLFEGRNPVPVILDPALQIPIQSACLQPATRRSVVICNRDAMPEIDTNQSVKAHQLQHLSDSNSTMYKKLHALLNAHPEMEIIALAAELNSTRLKWGTIIESLTQFSSIMIEGGISVIEGIVATFSSEKCPVDHVLITVCPLWIGSQQARPMNALLSPTPRLQNVMVQQVGTDAVVQGFINQEEHHP